MKLIDVDDDARVDRFNELYSDACRDLGIDRESSAVSYVQAATVLDVSPTTVIRYAYSKPPLLRKESRGAVSLDDVVQRKMMARPWNRSS